MSGERARRRSYTWKEYRSWPDDERWELVDGQAYAMTPAPKTRHQRVSGRLGLFLQGFFRGKDCVPFAAPTDLKLSNQDVVQPDHMVVCDPGQILDTHVEGAPTLVVEILSPSTIVHDRVRKMALYARSGVKELWLVTPYPSLVEVYVLEGGSYQHAASYEKRDTMHSALFEELTIPLCEVFDFEVDPGEEIMLVREAEPPYAGAAAARDDA